MTVDPVQKAQVNQAKAHEALMRLLDQLLTKDARQAAVASQKTHQRQFTTSSISIIVGLSPNSKAYMARKKRQITMAVTPVNICVHTSQNKSLVRSKISSSLSINNKPAYREINFTRSIVLSYHSKSNDRKNQLQVVYIEYSLAETTHYQHRAGTSLNLWQRLTSIILKIDLIDFNAEISIFDFLRLR